MSMITATIWVPRGAAAAFPEKYDVDEEELARISKLAKLQLEDAKEDLEEAANGTYGNVDVRETDKTASSDEETAGGKISQSQGDVDNNLQEYDLDNYDQDSKIGNGGAMSFLGHVRSLAYYDSNADDPHITMQEDEDEDDERTDLQILDTDNMLVAAKVEDEVAHLEVYVYEDEADNLYVHHDIMLPAIPLCLEWLDLPIGKDISVVEEGSKGNYIAVGTFEPDIEIWNLDTVDCMYPNAILGQGGDNKDVDPAQKVKQKKRRRKSKKINDDYHVDAVLSLAANRQHRNLLASSSADKTVKLWDLNFTKCAKSYAHHTDKICSIAWNPRESTVLLSGSYDRTVVAADMRAPDGEVPRWGVESDVEAVMWDPHNSNYFYITTESGIVHNHDIRNAPSSSEASKAVWTLQAHDEAVSAFDINPVIPGFLATGSPDKTVKLWNIQPTGPSMVVSRHVEVGKVFSTKFAPDPEVAFRLAVSGSKGAMQIWDTSTNAAIRRIFENKMAPGDGKTEEERIVGIEEDSSDSEVEGGVDPGGTETGIQGGQDSMDEEST